MWHSHVSAEAQSGKAKLALETTFWGFPGVLQPLWVLQNAWKSRVSTGILVGFDLQLHCEMPLIPTLWTFNIFLFSVYH